MDRPKPATRSTDDVWLSGDSCSLSDFRSLVERTATPAEYPLAQSVERNVPVYDAAKVEAEAGDRELARGYMAEWHRILLDGPGIVVFRGAIRDMELLEDVSRVLRQIIAEEREATGGKGDHFAKAGSNARVWNSHEKLCMRDPQLFARYAAREVIDLVSRSWLGPLYQITCQVNLVYPGGKAQVPHRDYHMGFQQEHQLREYPATVHRLSPALTLQGGISHCDMTRETAPPSSCPTRNPTSRVTLQPSCPRSATTSSSTSCRCRWRGAMRCFSIRRFFTPRAPMRPPMSNASPT